MVKEIDFLPLPSESKRTPPAGLELLTAPEQELHNTLFQEYRRRAIDPKTFKDYDQARIKQDLSFVARREADFLNNDSRQALSERRGEVAEAIIWNGIENNGWLGPDAQVIVPSRYDDITNGVDQIVEFIRDEGLEYLALSIDVTSSRNSVYDKLREIRQKLKDGQLASIKYFHSKEQRYTGRKDDIPLVVVGLDHDTIRELSVLETKLLRLKREIRQGADNDYNLTQQSETKSRLGNHWVQILLLDQIKLQLAVFESYANRKGEPETAGRIGADRMLVERLWEEKMKELAPGQKERGGLEELVQGDRVHQTLVSALKDFPRI